MYPVLTYNSASFNVFIHPEVTPPTRGRAATTTPVRWPIPRRAFAGIYIVQMGTMEAGRSGVTVI